MRTIGRDHLAGFAVDRGAAGQSRLVCALFVIAVLAGPAAIVVLGDGAAAVAIPNGDLAVALAALFLGARFRLPLVAIFHGIADVAVSGTIGDRSVASGRAGTSGWPRLRATCDDGSVFDAITHFGVVPLAFGWTISLNNRRWARH